MREEQNAKLGYGIYLKKSCFIFIQKMHRKTNKYRHHNIIKCTVCTTLILRFIRLYLIVLNYECFFRINLSEH